MFASFGIAVALNLAVWITSLYRASRRPLAI